jgi:FKBP-type peptidyl-prolyl cis-trans isomerase
MDEDTDKEALVNRLLAVVGLAALMACGGGDNTATPSGPTSLQIEDLTVGTGATAATGDTVSVLYTGTFLDGRVFDASSLHGNVPITFRLGAGQVIQGWEQGLVGMRVGGKRRLTIPSSLAYGPSGNGPIPPNTPLRFEVELVAIAGK